MQVIIPLAGKGTRLRPHTHTIPKPLLHVAGKPAISYILDEVNKLSPSRVVFITGHLRQRIEQYVTSHYRFNSVFIEQLVQNGTAGAIGLAENQIDEPILIIFVDTLFEVDFRAIKVCKTDGLIWCKEVDDYQRFGVVLQDAEGCMTKIVEKPREPVSRLANIGMYYVSNYKLLFEGINHLIDHKQTNQGEYWLTDALQYMVEHGSKIKVLPVQGWYDCGKKETLLETNAHFLGQRHRTQPGSNVKYIEPVYIEEGCVIEQSTIGPNVSIAANCRIVGSSISNSIVAANTVILRARISDSLIGEDVYIEGGTHVLSVGDHCEIKSK